MKLKFDSNLEYQKEAIMAVTDLFEGLPPKQSAFEVRFTDFFMTSEQTDLGVANQLGIHPEQMLKNLHTVQERNLIPTSRFLVERDDPYCFPNFSVEMETGTGKTYTAFQIIWRLWKAGRKKRILFLADRNVLVDQTMVNDFRPFGSAMAKLSTSTKTIERDDGSAVALCFRGVRTGWTGFRDRICRISLVRRGRSVRA